MKYLDRRFQSYFLSSSIFSLQKSAVYRTSDKNYSYITSGPSCEAQVGFEINTKCIFIKFLTLQSRHSRNLNALIKAWLQSSLFTAFLNDEKAAI